MIAEFGMLELVLVPSMLALLVALRGGMPFRFVSSLEKFRGGRI